MVIKGPEQTALDMLREAPGSDKIYVQADMGLDEPVVFLVDTGASVSVVNAPLVEALGLEPLAGKGVIEGIGGTTPWTSVVLPTMKLGDFTLHNVEAAAGVTGVPSFAGGPPYQGILGNNVWRNFVLSVDYPADSIQLERPEQAQIPESSVPMLFDGLHCYSFVRLEAEQGETVHQVLLAIDTGARGILLSGFSGAPLGHLATEGEEPMLGIGSGENLPATGFIRRTRRIPIDSVELGGATIEDPGEAQWVNFEGPVRIGPSSMPGLLGHTVLHQHRVIFDYPGERFALVPSTAPERSLDGHQVLLDADLERHGDDPDRALYRARLLAWVDQEQQAIELMQAWLERHPDDEEAAIFLARLHLYQGELDAYWELVSQLDAASLAEQGELVTVVNGLALQGKGPQALELAQRAVEAWPDRSRTRIALADALLSQGEPQRARLALAEANRLDESPDGHLLRRARVALAEGDRIAALSHLRRLLEVLPSSGFAIWFYQHVSSAEDLGTMSIDLDRAMARLHPGDRPLDFLASALDSLGQDERVDELLAEGLERDCEDLEDAAADNCQAWYRAMADRELDVALESATLATEAAPHRPDYLDTLAMVQWRQGKLEQALETSTRALRLSPEDIYLAWQVDRLAEALQGPADQPTATPGPDAPGSAG